MTAKNYLETLEARLNHLGGHNDQMTARECRGSSLQPKVLA
jgi:hypothetical protein